MWSIRIIFFLLFCQFANGQFIIDSYKYASCPTGFFADNAMTAAPCEVNGAAGITDPSGTDWDITIETDPYDGSYNIRFTLLVDLATTSEARIAMPNMVANTTYTVSMFGKSTTIGGNYNARIRCSTGGGFTTTETGAIFSEDTGTYTESAVTVTTDGSGGPYYVEYIGTSTGTTGEYTDVDLLTVTE